jgi:hypothetical protein
VTTYAHAANCFTINTRHFKGYSFAVPPAWAKHHGFIPEDNATVNVVGHDAAASLTRSIYGLNDPMIGRLLSRAGSGP